MAYREQGVLRVGLLVLLEVPAEREKPPLQLEIAQALGAIVVSQNEGKVRLVVRATASQRGDVVEFHFVLGEIDGLPAYETATALLDVKVPNQIVSVLTSERTDKPGFPHRVAPFGSRPTPFAADVVWVDGANCHYSRTEHPRTPTTTVSVGGHSAGVMAPGQVPSAGGCDGFRRLCNREMATAPNARNPGDRWRAPIARVDVTGSCCRNSHAKRSGGLQGCRIDNLWLQPNFRVQH